MATREEVLTNLTKAAKQGNIRDAYRDFEELPFVDQVAISISPGIGDALAVYEIGEFGARGAKNIEEKDFLGALGNYGLSGLSAISILPLFRLFRGAKAIKAIDPVIDAPTPPKKTTEAAPKKAEETLPVPKVEEFKPLSLDEMTFKGTRPVGPSKVGSDGKVISGYGLGLTSKAAKFINTNKKLPNQTSMVTYINALKKGGISNGELRLLNLTDEFGDVHPKLLDEIQSSNPLDKITRQRLARYIKENQSSIDKGGIQKRMVSDRELEAPRRLTSQNERYLSNETEFTYHLPKDKYERGDYLGRHYGGHSDHEAHYVFDAAADLEMPTYVRPSSSKITGPTKPIVDKGDKVLNLGRIQSDYSKELGELFDTNIKQQVGRIIMKSPIANDLTSSFKASEASTIWNGRIEDLFEGIAAAARKSGNLASGKKLKEDFLKDQLRIAKKVQDDKTLKKHEKDLGFFNGYPDEKALSGDGAKYADRIEDALQKDQNINLFEAFIEPTKKVKAEFTVSPYKDTKRLVEAKKAKDAYNKVVPKINKLSAKEIELQKKINDSGLSLDSPSIADDIAELEKLGQSKLKLMPSNFDDITEFTLKRSDLEDATGKDFSQSLDKSLDEIFYELEAIKPGSPAVRQKYGPGTPEDRALKYFNELVSNPSPTFDIGNGVKILKRASKVKTDNIPGIKMDPYAVDNKTIAYKLPLRSRFLEAVSNNYDGFSLDSAAKRLGDEGGQDREFLQKLYDQDAPREIEKMLKELGVDPKEYIGKVDAAADDLKYSGTYVKIDDEIRKLVKEKGIDAFRFGGPVGIQESLNELNKTILPNPPDVGSIKPNDLDTLIKEVGTSPVGSEGAEAIILAMATLSMNPLQRAQAVRKHTAPLVKKLKSLHKEKQNYVENNSATQLNKYAERLNRYNRDIKSTEDRIKRISELYDPKSYNTGGPVDESKLEATERRLNAGEEIDDILKDLYGTAIANEFGEYDYNAPLRNFQDSIEKNLSNQFDFKYKDDLMDIYKSDDPGANIENRARKFSTNSINSLLDDLNLPVDVRRDNYGTSFDKIFNVAPNTNVTLDAYKSDDGDFTGDLNLRYSNRGKYGNIDLQSEINELGDTQDKIKYNQDIGPFSIQAGKTSGRDATGSVSYNLPSMSVGNAQTIQARAVVDNLLNAKGQLDYMYNNPNTGYFVNAGLGLNSQRGPEFNLKFGKNF
jgi:hypothetical protein